ncbi:MAG: hypothetical protein R3190_12950, partial [Thermoanaerobaculia bacterium]|nr:hypothetical protein [Thermoanaerobaculia bacterium]
MALDTTAGASPTLSFQNFWSWLVAHPNCILRAGTPETVIYDDDDLHWHFANAGPETMVVQLLRGKRLVGELLVQPEAVSYVQGYEGDHDEFVFELISENERERASSYFFVLSHAYDDPG